MNIAFFSFCDLVFENFFQGAALFTVHTVHISQVHKIFLRYHEQMLGDNLDNVTKCHFLSKEDF